MNKILLDNEPKITTGFKVPENYFENFEVKIPVEATTKKSTLIQLVNNNKWILSAAAILILCVTIVFQWDIAGKQEYVVEVEDHLLYNSTLSDDDIVNLLDEETISNMKIESSIDNIEIEQTLIEESNIENYITN